MKKGQPPQPLGGGGELLDLRTGVPHKCIEGRVDGRHQDLFFVLEVEIDGAVSDACAIGDVGDSRIKKALVGEHGDRSIEDALVFFSVAICAAAGVPCSSQRSLRVSLHRGAHERKRVYLAYHTRNLRIHRRGATLRPRPMNAPLVVNTYQSVDLRNEKCDSQNGSGEYCNAAIILGLPRPSENRAKTGHPRYKALSTVGVSCTDRSCAKLGDQSCAELDYYPSTAVLPCGTE